MFYRALGKRDVRRKFIPVRKVVVYAPKIGFGGNEFIVYGGMERFAHVFITHRNIRFAAHFGVEFTVAAHAHVARAARIYNSVGYGFAVYLYGYGKLRFGSF